MDTFNKCEYQGSCTDCVNAGSKYVTLVNLTKCCLVNLSVMDVTFIDVVRELLHCSNVPEVAASTQWLLIIVWILLATVIAGAIACITYCVWIKRGWLCMRLFGQLADNPGYGSLLHSSANSSVHISASTVCMGYENSMEMVELENMPKPPHPQP